MFVQIFIVHRGYISGVNVTFSLVWQQMSLNLTQCFEIVIRLLNKFNEMYICMIHLPWLSERGRCEYMQNIPHLCDMPQALTQKLFWNIKMFALALAHYHFKDISNALNLSFDLCKNLSFLRQSNTNTRGTHPHMLPQILYMLTYNASLTPSLSHSIIHLACAPIKIVRVSAWCVSDRVEHSHCYDLSGHI